MGVMSERRQEMRTAIRIIAAQGHQQDMALAMENMRQAGRRGDAVGGALMTFATTYIEGKREQDTLAQADAQAKAAAEAKKQAVEDAQRHEGELVEQRERLKWQRWGFSSAQLAKQEGFAQTVGTLNDELTPEEAAAEAQRLMATPDYKAAYKEGWVNKERLATEHQQEPIKDAAGNILGYRFLTPEGEQKSIEMLPEKEGPSVEKPILRDGVEIGFKTYSANGVLQDATFYPTPKVPEGVDKVAERTEAKEVRKQEQVEFGGAYDEAVNELIVQREEEIAAWDKAEGTGITGIFKTAEGERPEPWDSADDIPEDELSALVTKKLQTRRRIRKAAQEEQLEPLQQLEPLEPSDIVEPGTPLDIADDVPGDPRLTEALDLVNTATTPEERQAALQNLATVKAEILNEGV